MGFSVLGVRPSARDVFPDDPLVQQLVHAARKGRVKKVHALVAQGADPNLIGTEEMTPMVFVAARRGSKKGFAALLAAGADPNYIDSRGRCLAGVFANASDPYWLRVMLDNGLNPDLRSSGNPLLINAILNDNGEPHVQMLLAAGADINQRSGGGKTALMTLVQLSRWEEALMLLEQGADPWFVANTGGTVGWQCHKARPITGRLASYEEFRGRLEEMGVPIPGPSPEDIRQRWKEFGKFDRLPNDEREL